MYVCMVAPGAGLIIVASALIGRYGPARPDPVAMVVIDAIFVALFFGGSLMGAAAFLLVARHVVPRTELERWFVRPESHVVARIFAALFRALCPEPRA
jgi:hypothetical protein